MTSRPSFVCWLSSDQLNQHRRPCRALGAEEQQAQRLVRGTWIRTQRLMLVRENGRGNKNCIRPTGAGWTHRPRRTSDGLVWVNGMRLIATASARRNSATGKPRGQMQRLSRRRAYEVMPRRYEVHRCEQARVWPARHSLRASPWPLRYWRGLQGRGVVHPKHTGYRLLRSIGSTCEPATAPVTNKITPDRNQPRSGVEGERSGIVPAPTHSNMPLLERRATPMSKSPPGLVLPI
jgi:hypothetical protein